MNNPEKVIVYRSVAEQRLDEYLYGEGFFSPTGATDILLLLFVVAIIATGYLRFKDKRRWN
jgi:hypothetical protein